MENGGPKRLVQVSSADGEPKYHHVETHSKSFKEFRISTTMEEQRDVDQQEDDTPSSRHSHKLYDVESQVVRGLTVNHLSERNDKTDRYHEYMSPLPIEGEDGCPLPIWMVISITLLSIVGILGAIFELRYQFQ